MSDILKLNEEERSVVHHAGWDFLVAEPGQEGEVPCRICGETMAVRRGVVGPTGWAHATAIKAGQAEGRCHDAFFCRHSGEAWHRQALALKLEARKTPSSGLEKVLLDEAEQVIRARTATKEVAGLP